MERIPVVDGSLKGWLHVMAELRAIEAQRVVPGHGPAVADWPEALEAQERYLRLLLAEIRAVIRDGGTIDQAVAGVGSSERKAWLLFDDYNARNVVTAFSELEWE
jgi:glyoxylase-like metal-dependent hydrolase (beta-lactamase superfamily II)